MANTLYLINPADSFPSYYGSDVLAAIGQAPTALIADLATTTVAALAPPDFTVTLCDEHIAPADLDSPAEIIGITGKSGQSERMIELAGAYRQRGKIILIGGPYASLSPERMEPYADILITGEIEEIAPQLFADLRAGRWQPRYTGTRPDLRHSPLPRWDLYPNDRAMMGCVQTSRGCPFECEFCDVIQYVGRKQRHKNPDQVLNELDLLYQYGYRSIFLADDNLTVYRRHALSLLSALREWNDARTDGRVFFSTQLSIDTARETEILELLAAAGPFEVFIGLETPNEASLRETKKRQNVGVDLVAQVQRFFKYGISVTGGMIVGFDADGPDIFQRQYDFVMETSIPISTIGVLMAPAATPLYARMEAAGRLQINTNRTATADLGVAGQDGGASMTPWGTNIRLLGLTPAELDQGMRWLTYELYRPEAFGDRLLRYIDMIPAQPHHPSRGLNTAHQGAIAAIRRIARLGDGEAAMLRQVMNATSRKPGARAQVMAALFRYMQIRHMYSVGGIWPAAGAPPPQL